MGIKLESIDLKTKRNSRCDEQETLWWNGLKEQNGEWSASKKIRRSSSTRRANDEKTGEYVTRVIKSYFRFVTCYWRQ